MLARVTDGSVTSMEAREALKQVEVAVTEMIATVDIAHTPTEELRQIMQKCGEFSAKLAEFEKRAEAILAVIEHQGGDDAAVA